MQRGFGIVQFGGHADPQDLKTWPFMGQAVWEKKKKTSSLHGKIVLNNLKLTAGVGDFLPGGIKEASITATAVVSYAGSLRMSGARVHLAGISLAHYLRREWWALWKNRCRTARG